MKHYSHKHLIIVIILLILSILVFRSVNKNEPIPSPEDLQGQFLLDKQTCSARIHPHMV